MRIKFKSYEKTEEERISAGVSYIDWYLYISESTMRYFSNKWRDVIDPDAIFNSTKCYKIEAPSWSYGHQWIAPWLVEEIEEIEEDEN